MRGKATVAGAALCAASACAPSGAMAQRIDQYLNPDIRGVGENPGVTVSSRLRPEYDYPGIDLGSFIAHPELTQSFGYDDNTAGTSSSRGSSFEETQGNLDIMSRWLRDSLRAGLSFDNNTYFDQPRQSFTSWTANVAGSYEIGRDTLSASFTHLNLNQTPRDLGAPQLDSPIAFRIDAGRVGYNATFGRLSIQPGVQVTGYGFDDGTVQGAAYTQAYRDRVVVTPSVTAAYEFAPLRSAVLIFSDSDASYSSRQAGQPSRDYNDFSLLAGVNYDTGGKVRLRALVGYEQRSFSSGQYSTISAPIAEAAAIWTPTGLTTVTGAISRYIEDSASEVTVGYTETALRLIVDHELLRNVLLRASGTYAIDDYDSTAVAGGAAATNGGSQSSYSIDASATWLVNRHLRLVARYDYTSRQSGGSGAFVEGLGTVQGLGSPILGSSYSENRILFQVKIGL